MEALNIGYLLVIFLSCCYCQSNVIESERSLNEKQDVKVSSIKLDKILTTLLLVQNDVRNLKQKVKLIDTKLFTDEETTCKRKDETRDYIIQNCGNNTQNFNTHYTIDGDYGKFSKQGFCRVIIPKTVDGQSYKITARLYNNIGPQGVNSGFLGLAYNVQDEFNFDFVYLRIHRPETCFRSGFLQNGKVIWTGGKSGTCPEGPPPGRKWFKMQIFVHESAAVLYLNGIKTTNLTPHFPTLGRGGVVVATGHRNIIQFKHYDITTINKSNFKFFSCKSYNRIGDDYYLAEGEKGEWPTAGFCRALSKTALKRDNYAISVSLYNQALHSRNDHGLMGVMYNVLNEYNYDFVYFRPKSYGGCYTTGYVQNSQLHWVNSKVGSCPGGPLKKNTWINITVNVRGHRVTVLADNKHIVASTTHFPPTARGGVLLSNGRQNVVAFRHFNIIPIKPDPFSFHNCAEKTKEIGDYIVLDAQHGKWPEATFCKAISKKVTRGKHYFLSSELFIQNTLTAQDSNYFGLMFNAKDENNYDFVYLTPHKYHVCFKVGYVINSQMQWSGIVEGECPGGKPMVGSWAKLELAVGGSDVMMYLNGKHLFTYKAHYPTIGRGGVIVGNGFTNVLSFRNFLNYKTQPSPFYFRSCGEGTHNMNDSFLLDASLPKTRPASFCRAVSRELLAETTSMTSYAVSASFFNVDSWQGADWGTFGLIYNAKDNENFDFFLLNLQKVNDCYEYGSLFNGAPKYNRDFSGKCLTVPPARKWFTLKVHVKKDTSEVLVTLNGKELAKIKSRSPFVGRGGVLVLNGSKNEVMFKDFRTNI
ncbi:uncharacterized protein LOC130655260 [Hydractinia symbiolongicarpus]|uniref:uncharacterized protein LOC130655260 n=1 Tax=Hydractinia symbiolongicarpus TaxID=13093 RepID=UPI00254A7A67|nr:uncharacterized protein LOC130655260 [Hydractinia symbiolongicarpus]